MIQQPNAFAPKRHFGGTLMRLLRGGVKLSEVEYQALCALVAALPLPLRSVVNAQLNAYNLVQREIDGRTLNFYFITNGRAGFPDELPRLRMKTEKSPLIKVTLSVDGTEDPLHAVMTAIDGRAFCVSFSRPACGPGQLARVLDVEQSWKSSVTLGNPHD